MRIIIKKIAIGVIWLALASLALAILFLSFHAIYRPHHDRPYLLFLLNTIDRNEMGPARRLVSSALSEVIKERPLDLDAYIGIKYTEAVLSSYSDGRSLSDIIFIVRYLTGKKRVTQERGMVAGATAVPYPVMRAYREADRDRLNGRYDLAAIRYLRLGERNSDSPLGPHFFFQAGSTYLFDLNNSTRARQIFARIAKEYPTSAFSNSPYVKPEDESRWHSAWDTFYIGKIVSEALKTASVKFTLSLEDMISGYIKLTAAERRADNRMMIYQNYWEIGDACEQLLKSAFVDSNITIERSSLSLLSGSRIAVNADIKIGRIKTTAYMRGEISLARHLALSALRTEKIPATPGSWIGYYVDELRIGPFTVPPSLVNEALARSIISFPYTLESFRISPDKKICAWEGLKRKPSR